MTRHTHTGTAEYTTLPPVTSDSLIAPLLTDPLWKPEHLGLPIPDSPHAVSCCLPTWQDNVGYEEQEPRVIDRLTTGYPRFVYNRFCRALFDECQRRFARSDEACLVFASHRSATRCAAFLESGAFGPARLHDVGRHGGWCVTFPSRGAPHAKAFWQHSGIGVSSRQAAAILENRETPHAGEAARQQLRRRIGEALGVSPDDVRLFPTGISAFYVLHRVLQRAWPGRKLVQFGFPYVDSLKIPQAFGAGVHFFPRGDAADLQRLEELLSAEPVAGIATELPANPLLRTPDLERLSQLARRAACPLIVDDTLSTPCNVDLLSAADVIWSSLTKYFSGRGDVTGGALAVNRRGRFADRLFSALQAEYEDLLWGEDAVVLEANSRDFEVRVATINRTAAALAGFLREHPAVAAVHYPPFAGAEHYSVFQRLGAGYGGLLSIDLHDAARRAPQVFDRLRVCKGPNLGMGYTLACPFTILAHYRELEFAERCGVSRWLIRVSVGLEPADDLVERFREALGP